MNNICCIFAGSPEIGLPCLPIPDDAFYLCADSGLRLAQSLGITPHMVLGDFDSLDSFPEHLPHITAPVEKDDTDTMLAVRYALEHQYRDIRIFGAFGGRLDHTFANIQTLRFLSSHGAAGVLVGTNDYAYLHTGGTLSFGKLDGFSFSVFALTDSAEDITLTGTKYPLRHAPLHADFPLGVSNQITGESAEVSCGSGLLLIIGSRL